MLISREQAVEEFARRLQQRAILRYRPYPWQHRFHTLGLTRAQRMLRAANRVGKTRCAGSEVSYHVTGRYPDWWDGKRFTRDSLGGRNLLAWTGSPTNETSRDIVQKELLGDPPESFTGTIPGEQIHGRLYYRQAGVSNVVDSFRVKRADGLLSTVVLKTYEQGWRKWQGTGVHLAWLDEEPEDFKIYTEALTRILNVQGVLIATLTPLLGKTELIRHFEKPELQEMLALVSATWDDAPHLDKSMRDQLMASYPDYERDARTKGVPVLGSGRIFPIDEDEIKCDAFEAPDYFAFVGGMDFGVDHPTAYVVLAWNRDRDIVYVVDAYRQSGKDALYHAAAIKQRGSWIPVAWPHDGLERDKGSGQPLRDIYARHGVNMLPMHAAYGDDRGNAVEPGIEEMLERMRTGRLKVFRHLGEWFEEFRDYHRDDGKVVKVRDDLMAATRYALMMLRYSISYATATKPVARVSGAPARKLTTWRRHG